MPRRPHDIGKFMTGNGAILRDKIRRQMLRSDAANSFVMLRCFDREQIYIRPINLTINLPVNLPINLRFRYGIFRKN